MRNLLHRLTFWIFLSATIFSCKKDSNSPDHQVVNVIVKANTDYSYEIGPLGDEDELSISRQPLHYLQSEIHRSADASYIYKPALNFTGTDEVELRKATGSDGATPNNKVTYILLKFSVTN